MRVDATYLDALAELTADLIERFPAVHAFAWKEGARGGRYWLPDGKPDAPAHRLYGKKAEAAAQAAKGGAKTAKGGPSPAQARKAAEAKYAVARDAHAAAARPGSGVPPDRVAWLKARMDKARADLGATPAKPAPPAKWPPSAAGLGDPNQYGITPGHAVPPGSTAVIDYRGAKRKATVAATYVYGHHLDKVGLRVRLDPPVDPEEPNETHPIYVEQWPAPPKPARPPRC